MTITAANLVRVKHLSIGSGIGLLLCLTPLAFAQNSVNLPDQAIITPTEPLLIGPGDLLTVQVFETPDLSSSIRVSEAGTIKLPLGGQIAIAGLTPDQAASQIEGRLKSEQIMLAPHVTILVTQYSTQGVSVLGEVTRPGTFTLLGPHSLYDALSAAGGTTANQGSHITISHKRDPAHPVIVDVTSANYSAVVRATLLLPGDTVVVSRADLVYVVGDVVRPGPFPIVSGVPLSVLNVLGLSQGLNRTAAEKNASIVRQQAGGVITIPLDLNRIMKSKDPNPILQASDILVIPRSGRKVFLEYALPATTSAVTSAVTSALIVR